MGTVKITEPRPGETHRIWTTRLAKANRTTRRRVVRHLKATKRS